MKMIISSKKKGISKFCAKAQIETLPVDSRFLIIFFQGPAFFLEDGRSAMAISDALMWAKVNPFSPLGSGVRINPF